MAGITPITVQEAIKALDAKYGATPSADDREYVDAMVSLLEAGHAEGGRDASGALHFRVTPAGEEHAANLIRKMSGGAR